MPRLDEGPIATSVSRPAMRLPATQRFPLALDFIENADGTYDILNVAVLYPVKRNDFDCTLEWMQEAVRQWNADYESHRYMPVVKIGHIGKPADGEPERPTTGAFASRPRLVGDVLYVDYVGLNANDFQSLREGRYPYPSIEAIPSKHRITAISQLGCTLSQLKLPPVKFEASDGRVVLAAEGLVTFANGGSAMPQPPIHADPQASGQRPAMEFTVEQVSQVITQALMQLLQGGTAVTNQQQQPTGNVPQGQAAQVPAGQAQNARPTATASAGNAGGGVVPPPAPAGQPPAAAPPKPEAGGTDQPPAKAEPPKAKEKTEMANHETVRTFASEGDAIDNQPPVEQKVGKEGAEEANDDQKGGGSGEAKEVKASAREQAEISFRAFCVGLSHAGVAGMNNDAIKGHVKTMLALFDAGDEAGLHRYQAQIAKGEKVALGQRMGGITGQDPSAPRLSLFSQPTEATPENVTNAVAALAADQRTRSLMSRQFGLNLADQQQRAAVALGLRCQDGTDVVRLDY